MGTLCELFGRSRQAYYDRVERESVKIEVYAILEDIVVEYVKDNRKIDPRIGGLKLWSMFTEHVEGRYQIGRDAFFDILRDNDLLVKARKRSTRTTFSYHEFYKWPDLRVSFIPTSINQLWVADITYVVFTEDGKRLFSYLSLVQDGYSREIIGYKLARTMEAEYCIEALRMALERLNGIKREDINLIHHSDRGKQYASSAYVSALQETGIRISMTENGDPHDNPQAERINETVKCEFFNDDTERLSFEEIENRLKEIVDYYNNKRPHMSLNMMTPRQAAMLNGEIPKRWHSYRDQAIKALEEQTLEEQTL